MAKTIVIYQDEGVGEFGLSCLQRFFEKEDLRLVCAAQVVDGSAFINADMFVMPGGADLPYCKKLNGAGNKNIRSFVEGGGTYLGICAGAYYACSAIEYHKGRSDEICEPRELALIDATAIGSLPDLAPYYDDTLHSANIVNLTLKSGTKRALYYGGCTFQSNEKLNVLASYPDGRPAIVRKNNIILSGVHFEVTADDFGHYPAKNPDEQQKAMALSQNLIGEDGWKNILFGKTA